MISTTFAMALAVLPTVFATNYDVSVGASGQLLYDPQYVTAVAGDTVNFVFHPKNHTVTQSSFDAPCVPSGFDSGFMPVATEGGDLPSFKVTVNDTNPVWVHCEQKGHCGQGMVFAINPPTTGAHTFDAFKALAIQINGTASTSSSSSTSADDAYYTPPAQSWDTATATVTHDSSTWLTTYTSYAGTPEPTYAAQPVDHKITVGNNNMLVYADGTSGLPNITASIGDTVTFEFHQKNHTVTRSSFGAPCQPLVDTSPDHTVGFDSGFQFVAANVTSGFPTFQITVNDTAPIWGYCRQTGHCGMGMVFSINAVQSNPNNFDAFQALAKHINGTSSTSSTGTASSTAPDSSSTSTDSKKDNGALAAVSTQTGAMVALAIFAVTAGFL